MRIGKKERGILDLLHLHKGFLTLHKKYNGRICYRLLPNEMSPVLNCKKKIVLRLFEKGLLVRGEKKFLLVNRLYQPKNTKERK